MFLSDNAFREIPQVLSECPNLSMIGFKSNRIVNFPEEALPPKVRWLILTDNEIEKLPDSIGSLQYLQKLMLAGNRITALPDTMSNCKNIELIRLSANRLERLPEWIFSLHRLSWLACAGNPCMGIAIKDHQGLTEIDWGDIMLHETLGEGASGVISRTTVRESGAAAIKIFKGKVTSDGNPADEMSASIVAGTHFNLNTPHGKISSHPEAKEALLFPLIPSIYCNLGNPPDFNSCTRDIYDEDAQFLLPRLKRIVLDISSAAQHLHERGINHGDLYAHNILVEKNGHSMLGDFGAATLYDHATDGASFERLEVRAFGCLLEELIERCVVMDENERRSLNQLKQLMSDCLQKSVKNRPLFSEIYHRLSNV